MRGPWAAHRNENVNRRGSRVGQPAAADARMSAC